MRKILITGVAAVLALGLTACTGDDGSAAPPSSSSFDSESAPSDTSAPDAPSSPSGSETPQEQPVGQQIASKWGQLRYLAPGKFIVGDIVFFTATDTVLYVAGGTCPDGTTPPDDSKCSIDGFDAWVQDAPHNAVVEFSGQAATLIRETQ
ncbi:hypothetical protein [Actinocorallia populi]|uniref:hypothetical protein n=1 Tax=Actinocorallia populi TaxID=2079200 RepID=UPI000D08DB6C|nr:hypothetical protein [Actinocorallia populi]